MVKKTLNLLILNSVLIVVMSTLAVNTLASPQLLWGDTHLHTSYSFDAFLNGNQTADPNTAYAFATGQPVIHPGTRARVQLNTPLDFLVIADHAEFYGGISDIYFDGVQKPDPSILERIAFWYTENEIRDAIDGGSGPAYFSNLLPEDRDPIEAARSWAENTSAVTPPGADISARNAWQRMLESAQRYDKPGEFTALIGWEWSAVPGGANLHRVVITDADPATASKFLPFSSTDSPFPEDLWEWMDNTAAEIGARFVAIPHNSNISKGQMFSATSLRGEPLDADYAKQRARLEPLVEITQYKGDSETHPDLSPKDEFADFALYPWYIQKVRTDNYQARPGDYVRSALKIGLELDSELGVNPYAFGVVGSTDSHTGLATAEEANFWGKMATDSVPERKALSRNPGVGGSSGGPTGWSMQASGLAGVWAEANDRKAIVSAMQRKEVYGTTGPRIRLRFFGGSNLALDDLDREDWHAHLKSKAVPMGGNLTNKNHSAPSFLVAATKDPLSANLDRIQIVKGWLNNDGRAEEKVFDVVWSVGRALVDGKIPALTPQIDKNTGTWNVKQGSANLRAIWRDPEFDSAQSAFYYARVLQVPTPRHALLDAIALKMEAPTVGESFIRERAYSSPIWTKPF